MSEVDEFFNEPDSPLVVNGRYRIAHPDTGKGQGWQRASNYAAPLADQYGLTRWRMRNILRGLQAAPDIVALLTTANALEDSDLDQWAAKLEELGGGSASANIGTAVHNVLETLDRARSVGEPLDAVMARIPDGWDHVVHGYEKALSDNCLTPYAIEQTVLNVPHGAAGKFDRIYTESDGSLVIGDVKTTRRLEHAIHEYAVQFEIYATATHLVIDGQPRPIELPVRRDYAVLVQVNPDDGSTAVYRVPLAPARWGAGLAQQVRDYRNLKGLLLPYTPPTAVVLTKTELFAEMAAHPGKTYTVVHFGKVPETEMAVISSTETGTMVVGNETRTHVPAVVQQDDPTDQRVTELAKLPKPELQRMARALGWLDVAHHRKWLAEKIIEIQDKAGMPVPEGMSVVFNEDPAQPAQVDGTPEPTEPTAVPARAPGWEQGLHVANRINTAQSLAELHTVQREVVERHGDQGWTDEYAQLARVRLDQLKGESDDAIVDEINAATSTSQLAEIWQRVTLGGTAASRWNERLQAAGQSRMEALRAAQSAPANPFAEG